jgi:5-methyltetrahydropteroyltriglutamate--homocysteine methyltransferase
MSSGGYESISKQVFQRAQRYDTFPKEQLALATQCGFASVLDGNPIRAETQPAKLRLVAETAHQVWS